MLSPLYVHVSKNVASVKGFVPFGISAVGLDFDNYNHRWSCYDVTRKNMQTYE